MPGNIIIDIILSTNFLFRNSNKELINRVFETTRTENKLWNWFEINRWPVIEDLHSFLEFNLLQDLKV